MPALNTRSTVAEWVCEYPQTAQVFEESQIDYCCGGDVALAEACARRELDADSVLARLTQVITDPQPEPDSDWLRARLAEICDHIQQTHHAYLREELPRLSGLIEKIVALHGDKHSELSELQQVFSALRAELEPHMFKEEQILFPAIRQLEQSASRPSFHFGTVSNPIRMMEHEHDTAGSVLARIRELTNNFLPPADACNTYRVVFDSLEKLEYDMHQHIHKENNILFPRARQLEERFDNIHGEAAL